jgi:hypothetical protein
MTEKDLRKYIKFNSQQETLPTETGIEAGMTLAQIANAKNIDWAFAGGISMHLYGYVRATVGVDIIASRILDLESEKTLSFGGKSYRVKVGRRKVTVDWIVRDDDLKGFYQRALENQIELENGIKIISPEWLVILKHLSARSKDQLDLIWLLQESDLVNREQVKENIRSVLGEYAQFLINDLQSEFDYADVLKMRENRSKYE